jgi:hypothetical protein
MSTKYTLQYELFVEGDDKNTWFIANNIQKRNIIEKIRKNTGMGARVDDDNPHTYQEKHGDKTFDYEILKNDYDADYDVKFGLPFHVNDKKINYRIRNKQTGKERRVRLETISTLIQDQQGGNINNRDLYEYKLLKYKSKLRQL